MPTNLTQITTSVELDRLLAESNSRPVFLFKHSMTCSISSRALREFKSFTERAPSRIGFGLLTVQTARPVSDEVARRLSLTHETPQAILISNGHQVWNASHFAINTESLMEAVRVAFPDNSDQDLETDRNADGT